MKHIETIIRFNLFDRYRYYTVYKPLAMMHLDSHIVAIIVSSHHNYADTNDDGDCDVDRSSNKKKQHKNLGLNDIGD